MKKIILGIIASLLIASPVYAYTVRSGDTLWGLFGSKWGQIATINGINDPTKLQVGQELKTELENNLGATPTPTSSANRKYVETPDFFLYSPAVSGDTSITINDLEDIYGNTLTMFDFGSLNYGRIDPDGASVSESFTFTGISANTDGTYTLTGVKSVLAKYPYTQTSGLKRSHSINAIVRFTNTAAFYDSFANKENNEIVDGQWTFSSSTGGLCLYNTNFCIRSNGSKLQWTEDGINYYNYTSSSVSMLSASSTMATKAISSYLGIIVSSSLGMYDGSDGQGIYQKTKTNGGILTNSNGLYITTTSLSNAGVATTTPTAGSIPMTNGSTKLNPNWVGTTTPSANNIPQANASSTINPDWLSNTVSMSPLYATSTQSTITYSYDCGFTPSLIKIAYKITGRTSSRVTYQYGNIYYTSTSTFVNQPTYSYLYNGSDVTGYTDLTTSTITTGGNYSGQSNWALATFNLTTFARTSTATLTLTEDAAYSAPQAWSFTCYK